MSRFALSYSAEQAYLIPPDVKQVLGADHLCWFVHEVVERLDLGRFVEAYSEEGGVLYHPSLMLKVWLYAYLLGVTSSRRLEQRIREDLAFRTPPTCNRCGSEKAGGRFARDDNFGLANC